MRKQKEYPVTLTAIKNDIAYSRKVFLEETPHKGAFIDVFVLEGSYLLESQGEVYESLKLGESLSISAEESKHALPSLLISRSDGCFLGKIPYATAILPNMLLSRGIKLFCYLEDKSFNGGMLELGVSLYSEVY